MDARTIAKAQARSKVSQRIKYAVTVVFSFFSLMSVFRFINQKDLSDILLAFMALILVVAPFIMERFGTVSFSLPFYLYSAIYAAGPMLGEGYKLYYVTSWWDKFLHFTGGVYFFIFGLLLFYLLTKGSSGVSLSTAIVFAVFCSMAIAVIWEFVEFGADYFFGTDMQNDTWISAIHSVTISEAPGALESITDIDSVIVNGQTFSGYLDIGIIDTMCDLLIETCGAVLAAVYIAVDKFRHPAFRLKGVLHEAMPQHP